jgi:hypothetical protein
MPSLKKFLKQWRKIPLFIDVPKRLNLLRLLQYAELPSASQRQPQRQKNISSSSQSGSEGLFGFLKKLFGGNKAQPIPTPVVEEKKPKSSHPRKAKGKGRNQSARNNKALQDDSQADASTIEAHKQENAQQGNPKRGQNQNRDSRKSNQPTANVNSDANTVGT